MEIPQRLPISIQRYPPLLSQRIPQQPIQERHVGFSRTGFSGSKRNRRPLRAPLPPLRSRPAACQTREIPPAPSSQQGAPPRAYPPPTPSTRSFPNYQ
eukprot:9180993-Pyramimonas_sp.AAC.1